MDECEPPPPPPPKLFMLVLVLCRPPPLDQECRPAPLPLGRCTVLSSLVLLPTLLLALPPTPRLPPSPLPLLLPPSPLPRLLPLLKLPVRQFAVLLLIKPQSSLVAELEAFLLIVLIGTGFASSPFTPPPPIVSPDSLSSSTDRIDPVAEALVSELPGLVARLLPSRSWPVAVAEG